MRLFQCCLLAFALANTNAWTDGIWNPESDGVQEVKGWVIEGETRYEYGYEKASDGGEYDGFLSIVNSDTKLDRRWVYDDGFSESIRYVAILGTDRIGVVIEQYDTSTQSMIPEFLKTTLLLCDAFGELIEEKTLEYKLSGWYNHGDTLIMRQGESAMTYLDGSFRETGDPLPDNVVQSSFRYQFQGQATVNGVITDCLVLDNPGHYEIHIHESDLDVAFHVTIESVVDGIANGDDTNEAVIIDAKGNLFLNGAPYVSNTRIDIPGNYELSIQGEGGYEKRIWFTLHASIDNVEEGAWVSGPIRIYSNGTAMLLDEHPYGGHLISDARTYQLEVLGVNGYSRTIEFHITPEVVGIESGATYQDSVDFWVNGNARLNGETITGNVVLTEAGDYELTLYCAETLFQTLHFTLVNPSDESNCSAPFSYWTVLFGVLAAIGLIVLLKKK